MTDIDLDELERLAKAATPGPWTQQGNALVVSTVSKDEPIIGDITTAADASYIVAMHPGTALALIERLREFQTINCELEGFPYYKCRPCPNCGQHEIWCESYIEDNKVKYQIQCRACRGHIVIWQHRWRGNSKMECLKHV